MKSYKSSLLGALALLQGCAAVIPMPGGTTPGIVLTGQTGPAPVQPPNETLGAGEWVDVGRVKGSASRHNILGLFAIGNAGYYAAMDKARRRSGAERLVDCVGEIEVTSFLVIFASSTTVVRCRGFRAAKETEKRNSEPHE